MDEQEFFTGLAELAVRVGVNLQPDQELVVWRGCRARAARPRNDGSRLAGGSF